MAPSGTCKTWEWEQAWSGNFPDFLAELLLPLVSMKTGTAWAGLCVGQAGLAAVPVGSHKSQNGCKSARLGYSTSRQMPGLVASHVQLDCSTPSQAQDLGLEKCLTGNSRHSPARLYLSLMSTRTRARGRAGCAR